VKVPASAPRGVMALDQAPSERVKEPVRLNAYERLMTFLDDLPEDRRTGFERAVEELLSARDRAAEEEVEGEGAHDEEESDRPAWASDPEQRTLHWRALDKFARRARATPTWRSYGPSGKRCSASCRRRPSRVA
jgi:hypothetical protein